MKLTRSKNDTRPNAKSRIDKESFLHELSYDPFLDWAGIIVVSVLVGLTLVVIGVGMYVGTGDRLSAPLPAGAQRLPPKLDTAALNKVLGDFDGRAMEREGLMSGYTAPKDPSLP